MTTILTVVGARPQFIKAAAVSRAIRARDSMSEIMVHTGQHFDANMSDVFFDELEIAPPAHHLGIGGGGHGRMTGRMLEGIEGILEAGRPDWVLIYGDTNSTIAGALAAAKLHIPVAHVEAGLRSFNKRMPEEINRILTDHVSTLLFCPTQTAVDNLASEGITAGVHHVGDVMYDATLDAREKARETSDIVARLQLEPGKYVLSTVHRAENTDSRDALGAVLDHLKAKAAEVPVVLPLHPRTAGAVKKHGLDFDGLTVIDPVGYLDMAALLDGCAEVLTDSGGVQKEAYFHRKPCTTLRDETEWVETIEAGWNRLWKGADFVSPRKDIADYGDGKSAERILDLIASAG
ncbi:UDP-N-acetylglucosamine 2-epimerase (non-hydrolyzing) [Pyruvatibacter mobilis]|uniref:UDP-N-acetylglucosamine 2-epimerase (Non-hydrolyzing) n=1 Tax=Pyruvatibacter mobilis TaxID=1712261 RepID=A0A845Q7M4_9HYPH|nr:UDP-N-acetylglucosamine 2-epimerase (non-hydrolyzing) [Pyruvatibacter mobilis]NBG94407.1 UDP-N-acetylglucosamine 2-epimerase (non-hydrolyzing) [Pyruvatibacter mobilis]QJD73934.1 UDP-N-acetylglucosamine 2-epimerase (non-hydrolyzing) [Pyruvatibacter mobilis]GGD02702.1 UDP-N-acetyl glucosamine 2-epimerase [Pyruvatibacter mobilis]